MKKRNVKNLLYEEVALIGRALASPKRLELLALLTQGDKTVEALASELSVDVKLVSAHLRTLKEAHLVRARREGKHVVYRLSGTDVATLWVTLRRTAEAHLADLRLALDQLMTQPQRLVPVGREQILEQARRGEIVLIDVRLPAEYATAHLPRARSLPLAELEQHLAELPADKDIVAYCRGPFCLLADEAVALLAARGYRAYTLRDGVSEWRAAGLPLETAQAA